MFSVNVVCLNLLSAQWSAHNLYPEMTCTCRKYYLFPIIPYTTTLSVVSFASQTLNKHDINQVLNDIKYPSASLTRLMWVSWRYYSYHRQLIFICIGTPDSTVHHALPKTCGPDKGSRSFLGEVIHVFGWPLAHVVHVRRVWGKSRYQIC